MHDHSMKMIHIRFRLHDPNFRYPKTQRGILSPRKKVPSRRLGENIAAVTTFPPPLPPIQLFF